MEKKKRVLVCPLDWGLGHAARDVPVIELLLEAGAEVIIGADNKPLDFLRKRFPYLPWVRLEGYRPKYQKKGSLALKIAMEFPKMIQETKPVQKKLEEIITTYRIDAVVSDNRYELWSERVPTVFITHQLHIPLKGVLSPTKSIIRKMLYAFIKQHNELWIPDVAEQTNLSGILSHVSKFPEIPYHFIGPLSRFERINPPLPDEGSVDLLCIMSGPEPQRSILENKLIAQLKDLNYQTIILSAQPQKEEQRITGNVQIISHVEDDKMASLLRSAPLVISRSGYTTVMDLAVFGTPALFIPTPGQPEQEYLAERYKKEGVHHSIKQSETRLEQAIEQAATYKGIQMNNKYHLLRQRITALLDKS